MDLQSGLYNGIQNPNPNPKPNSKLNLILSTVRSANPQSVYCERSAKAPITVVCRIAFRACVPHSVFYTATDKLKRVMNAAARVVSGTRKYDRGLRELRHAELHWLDVADRITFKLWMTVHKCFHSHTPDYLSELHTPVAQVAEWQHLRSANRRLLVMPRIQLNTYGRRAFTVIGPTVWNVLSNDVCDPELSITSTCDTDRIRGTVQ